MKLYRTSERKRKEIDTSINLMKYIQKELSYSCRRVGIDGEVSAVNAYVGFTEDLNQLPEHICDTKIEGLFTDVSVGADTDIEPSFMLLDHMKLIPIEFSISVGEYHCAYLYVYRFFAILTEEDWPEFYNDLKNQKLQHEGDNVVAVLQGKRTDTFRYISP